MPATHLLGNPGDGFKIAMATLDIFRSTVGAAALGFARRALDEAARQRVNVVLAVSKRFDLARGPGIELGGEGAMRVVEERPGKEAAIGH